MNEYATAILTALRKIAPEIDPDHVDRAAPLAEQLDLDSMDYQSLLASLSTRYAVDIPEADVPGLRSVDDLAAYLSAHAQGAPS